MTVRLVISVTLPDDSKRFDWIDSLTAEERQEMAADGTLEDFLAQFTPEAVAQDFLEYAQGWYIPREEADAVYRVEGIIETPTVTAEVDGRWCEGEGHQDRPAAFQFVMLDTTSLDGIADLCFECGWDLFREWVKNPEDVNGWEVRLLPIPEVPGPRMIQGGPQ